jgi:predicted GIY-YIG superfamily endonuclease
MPVYTIYKIQCGNEVYVGSSRDFTQRKNTHKHYCHNETSKAFNRKIYKAIRENGGWDSKMISPIELFDCETSIEARIREQFWIREYNATLNTNRSYSTDVENVEQYNKSQSNWLAKNPNYHKEWRAKKKAEVINQQSNILDPLTLSLEVTP